MQQITQGLQHKPILTVGYVPRQAGLGQYAGQRLGKAGAPLKAVPTEQVGATGSNGASATPANPLDFEELTEIIRMVHDTDIVELELKSKKFSLAVRKKEAVEKPEPVFHAMPAPQAAAAPPPPPAVTPAAPAATSPAPSAAPPASDNGSNNAGGNEVLSPMSGTFYHAPAPGEPPFVKIGDRVNKGQVIGIIEAMKLMNEIEADSAGTIVEFTAENASSVTPGQSLVRIQP